jgi:Raf kinase inhibitor-like YbhB/YbcL family protein
MSKTAGRFRWRIILSVILLLAGGFWYAVVRTRPASVISNANLPRMITITSPAFSGNGNIPAKYTCDGDDVNPPLKISGLPYGTQSLILIVDDPDAPSGLWTHWVVFNIPATETTIAENSLPAGAGQALNDSGAAAWGGPCPPRGTHRYFFRIFALDRMLGRANGVHRSEIEKAMEGHVLDSGELVGVYERVNG